MRRLPKYRRLFNQYQRYLRKLQRINSNECKSHRKKHWLIKRITRLKSQLMAYHDSAKILSRSLAAGGALTLITPTIDAQIQSYAVENPNATASFCINADAHPVFVDFDGDGDDDFFLAGEAREGETAQEEALHYYRNDDGSYVKAAGPFPADLGATDLIEDDNQLEINPAFIDFDADGDMDAFIGFGSGGIRYFRNDDGIMTQSASENPFTVEVDSAFIGDALSPALGDVDGDGDLDLMLGSSGTLTYYQNTDTGYVDSDAFGSFSLFSDDSSPTLFDFDGDGDLDMLVGNKYGNINYYENNAGELTELDDHPLGVLNVGANIHPALTDFDSDGDTDLILGSQDGGLSYFINEGGSFDRAPSNELGITNSESWLRPTFFDYDADGDLDLFIGNEADELILWTNNEGTFAEDAANNPFDDVDFGSNVKPTFADYDGDGDSDLLVTLGSELEIFQADNGVYTEITDTLQNPFYDLSSRSNQAWALGDVDGDGDLDAILGHKYGGIDYYENNEGVYTEPTDNPFSGIDVGDYSYPTFADFDNDGDMDLLVGSETGEIHVFESVDGAAPTEEVEIAIEGFKPRAHSVPAVGDVDGDGHLDIIVGTQVGEVFLMHNITLGTATEDLADLSDKMVIFPNPASDVVQVEAEWNQGKADILVHDLNGRLLLQKEVFGHKNQLRVTNLPKGVYRVELRNTTARAIQNMVVR